MPINLAVFGDFHLGADFCPGTDWLLGEVRSAAPDALIFTGDLVDMRKGTGSDIAAAADLFRTITQDVGVPIVTIWGNHDAALDLHASFPAIPGVYRPASLDRVETLRVPGLPIAFHAINVAHRLDERSVVEDFPAPDPTAQLNIGVLHTSLTGEWSNKPCLPATLDELGSKDYDAWALGHVHRPPSWGLGQEGTPIAWPGVGQMLRWRF